MPVWRAPVIAGAGAGSLDTANRYTLFYAARGLPHPTPETSQADESLSPTPQLPGVPCSLSGPADVRNLAAPARSPPGGSFTGRCDLVHSPDFVSPPHRIGRRCSYGTRSLFLVVPECAEPKLAAFLNKSVPSAVRRADRIIAVSEQTKRETYATSRPPAGQDNSGRIMASMRDFDT